MTDEHITEILPAYALGVLDEADLLAVARHLPGCPTCRAELADWYRTADALSGAVPVREPSADLRRRVMERTLAASRMAGSSQMPSAAAVPSKEPGAPQGGWWQSLRAWFALNPASVIAVLLIVFLAVGNLLLLRQVTSMRAAQPAIRPGEIVLVRLSGTDAAPEATGYMIAKPGDNSGSLTVDGVPQLNRDQQYQVWLIKDGERTSGGVFSVDDWGYGVVQITAEHALDSYDSVGMTIEPAGGSPSPTGKKILGTDG